MSDVCNVCKDIRCDWGIEEEDSLREEREIKISLNEAREGRSVLKEEDIDMNEYDKIIEIDPLKDYQNFKKHMDYETNNTGAQKETAGKLRMDLIPPEVLIAYAEVLTIGAAKYSSRNWEKGLKFEEHHISAAMRHLQKWRSRVNLDEETGQNHMNHVLWHIAAVVTQIKRNREDLDDRPANNK